MEDALFTVVISAELAVDIFFWLTAFLSCFFLLNRMNDNDGNIGSVFKIYLNRFMRLFPLYAFTLFFFWKFLVLYGGDGPMFFMYDTTTECSKYWFWHLLFLNNVIPWKAVDTCMHWTWYLANDMQFFLLVPLFVQLYYNRRKVFYISMACVAFVSAVIQTSVILANDLSVSYFTYNDEYFTIYYVKPYARIPAFLLGMLAGCLYFSYKKEPVEQSKVSKAIEHAKNSNLMTVIWNIIGITCCIMMVSLL
jgi:peptidoglycan/LPS O-acetylase OafA/YrhL